MPRPSVPKKGADPLDRLKVLPAANGPHGSAVRERLVHGEVEPAFVRLEAGPVEGTLPALGGDAAASWTLKRLPVDAVLEEKDLDAPVRRGRERVRPARCRAAVSPGFVAPALDGFLLAFIAPPFQHGR